ncbi:MAG: DNA mismatch repair protein MutL [Calditrichaeota bacterium]|nr:DNA mismatch repair protein MutL [Calditrichota bacterium]
MTSPSAGQPVLPRGRIDVLPEALANRIAAGEVVERPASVVKELIENAIDAEAQRIVVSVKRAGLDEMLVADDGWGMDADDVALALRRHATSKLHTPDELQRILHFGFRGEALPSVASVSRLEILSRREDREHGVRLRLEGGKARDPEPGRRERGTTVSVRALFYNVPARRKFLRTPATEYNHVVRVFKQYALAYPEYAWELHKDGKQEYALTPADLRGRIGQLFGDDAPGQVHATENRAGDVFVNGVVGGTELFRRSRGDQFLYVNRRPIASNALHHAVINGYGPLIERGQVPFYVLNLRLDPEEFDVNVHPAKHEVRFRDEGMAYRAMLLAVRNALGISLRGGDAPVKPPFARRGGEHGDSRERRSIDGRREMELLLGKPPRPEPGERATVERGSGSPPAVPPPPETPTRSHTEGRVARDPGTTGSGWEHGGPSGTTTAPPGSTPETPSGAATAPISDIGRAENGRERRAEPERHDPHAPPAPPQTHGVEQAGQRLNVWQVHRTYILSQTKSGLVIIDQHVAHERILFEKALAAMRDRPWSGQRLLFPVQVNLDPAESALLEELAPALARMGMEVETAGGNAWAIHSVPAGIRVHSEEKLLRDLLADYRREFDVRLEPQQSLAASFACKAAIKAGDPLNLDEMNGLIDELFTTEYPFVCPHGRPIVVNLTLSELHRLFGRE